MKANTLKPNPGSRREKLRVCRGGKHGKTGGRGYNGQNSRSGGTKGPVAKGVYWFNQHILDGVVNGVGTGAKKVADLTYKYIDQGLVDGTVNGSGAASNGLGQAFRQLQTGKVQQYGALLFGGAIVLAGIFVFAI